MLTGKQSIIKNLQTSKQITNNSKNNNNTKKS